MASLAQMKREAEAQSMKALQDRREQTRQQFFKGREDITPSRLDRRQIQSDLLEKFKQEQMKPVAGASGVLQSVRPGGPTTADEAMRLARMYGPTMKEIGSDIGYGIRSIGSALGERIASGNFGIMGIAKGLFEKFSNAVSASKKAIGDQVNKLSDIDLEILKNKDKYKFTSKKPNLANIDQLEANAKQAAANRDYFGTYFSYGGPSMPGQVTIEEQVTTPVTEKTTPSFRSLPGTGYTPSPLNYNSMPGFTIQTDYESPEQKMQRLIEESQVSNLTDSGKMIYDRMKNLNMSEDRINERIKQINESNLSRGIVGPLLADASQQDINRITGTSFNKMPPEQIYEMRDVLQLSPDITLDEIQRIKEGTLTQPTGQYAANGGMIEKKLGDLQKKTNTMYGTGILSVR